MGAQREVLEVVSGWQAVELVLKCLFVGLWQLVQMSVKRLWKGHRRKASEHSAVELTVDSSVGRHCYIKVMGVKYHYVESGPASGHKVVVLCDAPESAALWGPRWCSVVQQLARARQHVVTLELRGTGASEPGGRRALAPPRAVAELAALMAALGVSPDNPATLIGFGIGGMLTWYLAHCHGELVRRMAVVGAPHPNLYWQFPPAPFCRGALHFIQWPYFPERWLAESEAAAAAAEAGAGEGGARPRSSRACDWQGALNYVRGAAWWRARAGARVACPALLVGGAGAAPELVSSAQHAALPTLRLLAHAHVGPADPQLPKVLLDFLNPPESAAPAAEAGAGGGGGARGGAAGLVGRVLGAVAGRGRELTQRLALPAAAAAAPTPTPIA